MRKVLCVALLFTAWLGSPAVSGVPGEPSASPSPVAHPAPVWRFDGEDYYLVDREVRPGLRTMAFLRDGDSPESCNRRLWLRKVGGKDLRAYEKLYTARWDQSQRDVRYRSQTKLIHSGWIQQGNLVRWRLMHWELQNGAIVCSEFELISRPPTPDVKSMSKLIESQRDTWQSQVSAMLKHGPAMLEVKP